MSFSRYIHLKVKQKVNLRKTLILKKKAVNDIPEPQKLVQLIFIDKIFIILKVPQKLRSGCDVIRYLI